jgi:outer membrane protein OmpA-like peptidoglycan-associated protein
MKTSVPISTAALLGVAMALTLAGCAAPPARPTATTAAPRAVSLADLEGELRRDLAGTPVTVERAAVSSESAGLRIGVPQPHGFEPGSAAVKPALAAVLDRLVDPLLGSPRWLLVLRGPIDARGGGSYQGQDRAAAVRDYLVARGVAAPRFEPPRSHALPGTEILLVDRGRKP